MLLWPKWLGLMLIATIGTKITVFLKRNLGRCSWLMALVLGLVVHAQAQENLALKKPVEASGPVYSGLSVASLTDGSGETFCHPLAASGTLGYYFEVDLGKSYSLERILLRNRSACCPERLTNYRVELYGDNGGDAGVLNWWARFRTNNSNSGLSGVDTILGTSDPAGKFQGRFIRIVNNGGAAYSPQIAEIEAYGAPVPKILSFSADLDLLDQPGETTLRWSSTGGLGGYVMPGAIPVGASTGSVTVALSQTTTYTLTITNIAGTAASNVLVGVGVRLDPPVITEFMADNGGVLKDRDGDNSDWIELYNPNPFRLNLAGYSLANDPAGGVAWTFPSVKIAPNAFKVVFASGKDRRKPEEELHTQFKLKAEGDYLALRDAAGSTIQQFPATFPIPEKYPRQLPSVSYGMGTNQAVGFLKPSTPNLPNGRSYEGVIADTKFSVDRQIFQTNLLVEITSDTADAVIRYTTNRTEPTATSGLLYSKPIAITATTIIRAAAFKPGWAPTDVDTQTYVHLGNTITASVMNTTITRNLSYSNQIRSGLLDLPSVSLTTTGTLNGSTEVKTAMEWLNTNGTPGFKIDCGIKQYGGAFTDFAKKSFRLFFKSEFGAPKLKYPIFQGYDRGVAPVEEFNQLELRSGSHDMAMRGFYMSNIFTDETLLEMGHLNPHGRFVHLYINGTYWGVYHLRERWDAAMHASYLGGPRDAYESINGNWNVGGWADPGVVYDGTGATWDKIKANRGNFTVVQDWLDVAEYVDYMLMWMFGGAEDEYRCVGPNIPGAGGFKFYLNDADGWFCGSFYCAANDRTTRTAPGRGPGDGPGSIFSMLFKGAHPDYRILLADHIQTALFNHGSLTTEATTARLTNLCDEISRAFVAESARWNYLTPTAWVSRRNEVLTNWLTKRPAEALAQFRAAGFYPSLDAPALSVTNSRVAPGTLIRFLKTTRGQTYYTTDGTDPRLEGGAVSSAAKLLDSAVATPPSMSVEKGLLLKARVKDGSNWSALRTAFFQTEDQPVNPGEVVVSEVQLDPARTGSEFVELLNLSDHAVNLRGARFTEGISYQFSPYRDACLAPGQRLVLARDMFQFTRIFGQRTQVLGLYAGGFRGQGERVTLLRADGVAICSFTYKAAPPWPAPTENVTFSMVLSHPELGLDNPAAWRASLDPNGSPGADDAAIFASDPIEDLDQDGIPALIEHALGTSDAHPERLSDVLSMQLDPQGYFTISFPRNRAADEVRLAVESSMDLQQWIPAEFLSTTPSSNGISREVWGIKAAAGSSAFLRLRVIRR